MFHSSSIAVAEAVVTWACIFPLLYPRADPRDHDIFGGDLSRGYRMTIAAVGVLVTIRTFVSRDLRLEQDEPGGLLFFAQVAVESFLNSFLYMLMPYLLQCQLRDRINIRPGDNLVCWLMGILALQLIGVVGRSYLDDRCWAIKRVGDSLSVFPVMSTAKLHFRIIPGQSKTIHQTLKAIEYPYLICTWLAVLSYALCKAEDTTDPFRGVRVAGHFLPRVRLFFHGFLLNMIDEASYVPPLSPPSSGCVPDVQVETVDEGSEHTDLSVALISSANTKKV